MNSKMNKTKKEISRLLRRSSMWMMIGAFVLGNIIIACAAFYTITKTAQKTAAVHQNVATELSKAINDAARIHEKILQQNFQLYRLKNPHVCD